MPYRLFLKPQSLSIDPSSDYEWSLYDVAGSKLKKGAASSLENIDQDLMQNGIENVDVVALIPAKVCLRGQVSLPGNQSRYIQQTLPFAVEELLAQDVESMHIVAGAKNKADSRFPFTCIDSDTFQLVFDELNDFCEGGYRLKGIFIDADCLSQESEPLVISISSTRTGGEALVWEQNGGAIGLTLSNLKGYMESVLDKEDEEDADASAVTIKMFVENACEDQVKLLIAELEQYPNVSIELNVHEASQIELLSELLIKSAEQPVNLCQGEFRLINQSNSHWKKWAAVAAIAVIGFVLQLGVFVGKGMYYDKEAERISGIALTEYKKLVPNSKRATADKLPRIIRGKLNQSKQSGGEKKGFLDLLGEAGYQFNRSKNKSSLVFKSVNYSDQRGELSLEMHAASFDQLEQLKQALVDAGYEAKISSAVQENEYFRGRINVRGS